ncbi:M48 family metalloprotease [Desulfobulbus alkaliphilus]|uniref:M48 family metalloprotease n=1 Tax=Desulfobulbus alkaliphilus TaxID=869814 RepID=UPI001962291B|nr:M48 family metalloprotease [Desulfobulbus alkaliphilus]MBM9536221.1 M48 family metalloprotease [Desulfobulbus alkaliphilus]
MHHPEDRIANRSLNRRDFLWLAAVSTAGLASGCAINPVTGQNQLMLLTEQGEIAIDREHAPHQFSADYGAVQDPALNNYVSSVGHSMVGVTHRPHMPYSFRCVNASYVNAYVFPGGSVGVTRGIMLEMQNEAELGALLGHELAHVSARHTAARTSKVIMSELILVGTVLALSSRNEDWGVLAAGLGAVTAGALLARYSRADERQADQLGVEYMTRSGYSPDGMVGLMDVLRRLQKRKPSAIEMMFATHPMSEDRYRAALVNAQTTFRSDRHLPIHRERYMDHTVGLRNIKSAIEKMQESEKHMVQRRFLAAEGLLKDVLQQVPRDYGGLMLMAKCQLALDRPNRAEYFADKARSVYPQEAQAHHLSGIAKLGMKRYGEAHAMFTTYERMLPGNPNTVFLIGSSLEGMGRRGQAAEQYLRFSRMVHSGEKYQYAQGRLVEWGYVAPSAQ